MNRTRTSTFSESTNGGEDFNFVETLKTTGTGINARLGLIYRVVDAVRLGASVQTPTYIHLTDTYGTTLTSQYSPPNQPNVFSTSIPGYDYSITTPFRANGGVTVLLSKYGFLTGDVEYLNYGASHFNTTDGSTDPYLDNSNAVIASGYRSVVNLRVGAEGRLDIFRVRAGYARYASPYAGTASYNRDQNYFTGGLGIRSKSFFVDVAGVYLAYKDRYSPYTLVSNEVVQPTPAPATPVVRAAPVIASDYSRFTVSVTGALLSSLSCRRPLKEPRPKQAGALLVVGGYCPSACLATRTRSCKPAVVPLGRLYTCSRP
ncbi:OmpP1/FadL family transporter [Hymenobacter sp. BRD67]|uniref:OmpP1/FadL family transporter n=1 Tax=Hymenobacter sp. BRD67 TaxID=2675877 RepID=UPI001565CDB3|nr:hypothetical protein [Hymenobacter sp. BRD67]QKG54394.1 hypothetical protein GKZ67_19550 [Hymenobacter sp. BRD67]